jgi:hypothetical protein
MEQFLQTNPGLRSRIAFHVPFSDYTPPELFSILEFMAAKHEMRLAADVCEKVKPIFESAGREPDFGNGRFVRNLFEKAKMNQANRLVAMGAENVTDDDIRMLAAEDFESPLRATRARTAIGFAG